MQGLLRCLLKFSEVELSILALPASVESCLFVCLFVCVGAGDAPSPTIQMPEMDDYWMDLDERVFKGGCTFRVTLA
jgi:hypothetical protein